MSMREGKLINVEEGWDVLQKAITKVKNILEGLPEPRFTSGDCMMLYTTVYNMCTIRPYKGIRARARALYDKYKEAFEEYIISTVLPSLREMKDELLLRELLRRWSNHKVMTKWLSRFFLYLDDILKCELPSLKETGYSSFYYLVYKEMNKQLLDAILAMIDRKHAGEKIDRALVINTLDFYLEFEEVARKNNAKELNMHGSPSISSKKIKLISSDGDVFEVEFGVALMSKTFVDSINTIPFGDVDSISVPLLNSKMLTKIIEYCKKHNSAQKDVDLRDWDVQFVDVDLENLFELETSATYLEIDSLEKLASEKFRDLVTGMTPDEMAQFFRRERITSPVES